MSQNIDTATYNITVGVNYNTKTLNQLESQLEHIVELLERIKGQHDDTGMKLAADKGAETILDNAEKIYGIAGKIHLKSAIIGSAQTTELINDDHIRQIVREELRQFVTRESKLGGLFSVW
ncbi:hypothetical protein Xmau_00279 [Xenorhabdus mauleonii]|uniref:Uncharacterized protein n=1 Tax=Xenorhabdus mauleonii TaxID=351675 RepID=A0A1I3XXA4_9GAMM|nr:hypothetical protein [Xenorhabdus mauleonii]PHM45888.1 hypothetical protein Xmau_00279 [Xenorhabdus mauleonii]SFK23636.1 hypothetical protein SAMN05421680_13921 [Xenorhabdus mauleonii]